MKVKALEIGFYRGDRKRAGAVFTLVAGDKPGKWMEVLEAEQPKAEKPKAEKAEQPKAEK
jgi:hypothetical protein